MKNAVCDNGCVKMISRSNTLYYMIKMTGGYPYSSPSLRGGSIAQGSSFQGFGDPDPYGYAFGDLLYTNMVRENRVPPGVLFWQLAGLRVSMGRIDYEDSIVLLPNIVFSFRVKQGSDIRDLYTLPLFALPSLEGHQFSLSIRAGIANASVFGLPLGMYPGEVEFGCNLTVGEGLLLQKPAQIYIFADMSFWYESAECDPQYVSMDAEGD